MTFPFQKWSTKNHSRQHSKKSISPGYNILSYLILAEAIDLNLKLSSIPITGSLDDSRIFGHLPIVPNNALTLKSIKHRRNGTRDALRPAAQECTAPRFVADDS